MNFKFNCSFKMVLKPVEVSANSQQEAIKKVQDLWVNGHLEENFETGGDLIIEKITKFE